MPINLEVGTFPSGSYTINYYTSERWRDFELHNTGNIVIEKVSDNEPASGRVLISGDVVEDQVVTAIQEINDHNGMGELHYQWYRNGEAIPWATNEDYLLTDDDAGRDIHVTVSFEDGLGNPESVSSLLLGAPYGIVNIDDQPVGSVYIRGPVSVGSSLTIDTSGYYDPDGISDISYQWKRRYKAYSTQDQDIGLDSDTYIPTANDEYQLITAIVSYSNIDGTRESVETSVTGPVSPATRPRVTPPVDLTVPATGILTRIDPGMAIARDDDEGVLDVALGYLVSNGVETPPPAVGLLDLPSGSHLLVWSASDSRGGTGKGIQIVMVDPIIEFGADLTTSPDSPIGCPLVLNGAAARYPVTVPYTLTGVLLTDGSEELVHAGNFRIAQPQLASVLSISDTMLGNLSGYGALILTMDIPTNAVMGDKNTCLIALSNENFAPKVSLTAYQGELPARILSKAGGEVSIRSSVEDFNSTDIHDYDWSESDVRLIDLDTDQDSFTFDPANLEPGLYRVKLRVSDASANDVAGLSVLLVTETPSLNSVDSDGDGESNFTEGSGDSDADGIPNYLDPAGLQENLLLQEPGSTTHYLIQTDPGLTLGLGDIAFFSQRHGALITRDDILEYVASGLGGEADAEAYSYAGGLFDFRINDIPLAGSSVNVVIPQRQMIAPESIYRKLLPTGWGDFVEDDRNRVRSAPGEDGFCPPPGDSAYTTGLSEGAWCVELTIEDGGPNDADGVADGRIADPGGVTANLSSGSGAGSGSGGGGTFNLWVIVLLTIILFIQCMGRLNRYQRNHIT
ncbi:MAG: choice-of-anchor U domain-containing protein [Candidatus Thiodiazotropha endolucinida]